MILRLSENFVNCTKRNRNRGKSQKFENNPVVKYFRLWGMFALSIFSLQIYSLVPRAIFNPLFKNLNLMSEKFALSQVWWVLMFAVITVLFYDILLWLWSRINFMFSFEWLIIRLASLPMKQVSPRLNVKEMLHEAEWLNYKELSGK